MKDIAIKPCLDQLEYVSRPDCTDPSNEETCDAHHKACKDAVAVGLKLPEAFGACDTDSGPGLSQYQLDWINYNKCLEPEYIRTQVGAGLTSEGLLASQQACQINLDQWKADLTEEETKMQNSVLNLLAVSQCWGDMGGAD
jgi:hypothetical protein